MSIDTRRATVSKEEEGEEERGKWKEFRSFPLFIKMKQRKKGQGGGGGERREEGESIFYRDLHEFSKW